MRVLVVLHEAFGGQGGIAKFNRDLIISLCAHPDMREVVAVPRLMPEPPGAFPDTLRYPTDGVADMPRWLARVARAAATRPRYDLIVCAHINLLPIAYAARALHNSPVALVVHGIEAWKPTGRRLTDHLTGRVDALIAVSALTRDRLLSWADLDPARCFVLPNAIDLTTYTPGPADPALIRRWRLEGRRVILTLARLEAREQYKGVDEILESLPSLLRDMPDLAYVVAGGGSDRARLEAKAQDLGVGARVVFTGYVPEAEKRGLYRLADVFAMPSRGEGFGIVFLEAMACGVPVVASSVDGSREAVRGGRLGLTVDPADPDAIGAAIRAALDRPRGVVPAGLDYFDVAHFQDRAHVILGHAIRAGRRASATAL